MGQRTAHERVLHRAIVLVEDHQPVIGDRTAHDMKALLTIDQVDLVWWNVGYDVVLA